MADPSPTLLRGDTPAAIEFLQNYAPTGVWALVSIHPETGKIHAQSYRAEQSREAAAWIEWQQGKNNIYFLVNRVERLLHKKANKGDIVAAAALHVDVDPPKDAGNLAEAQAAILDRIRRFKRTPSIVLFSGGGYQAFWLLKEPITVNGPDDWAKIEAYNRGIERELAEHDGKIDGTWNIDRIMRLPGTINVLSKKKRAAGRSPALARVVEVDWHRFYSLEDFEPAAPEKIDVACAGETTIPRTELPEWARRVTEHGRDPSGERLFDGDRSRAVFAVACAMVRSGATDPEIVAALTNRENGISDHVLDQPRPALYAERQAHRAREKVGEGFVKTAGKIAPLPANVRIALLRLGVDLSYDTFSRRPYIVGPDDMPRRLLDDDGVRAIYFSVIERWGFRPPKDFFFDCIYNEALKNSFHPVHNYLAQLEWDGVRRVEGWLAHYAAADDDAYTRAVGTVLLVAGVRRIRHPGAKFDEMVVLESEQGLEKSTALATLAVRPEWFSDSLPLNADEKIAIEVLSGHWIVEAAELKGMRKGEIEHLKAFLSRQADEARLAYDRMRTEVPRQCIIVGTTNANEYLRDVTGNRRFWPVRVKRFDIDALERDRDQLWAEASVLEAQGMSIRLDRKLWADAEKAQERRMIEDPWVGVIEKALGVFKAGKILVADMWEIVNVPIGMRSQEHNARLGESMRSLGWERGKARIEGRVAWCYLKGTPEERQTRIICVRATDGYLNVRIEKDGSPNEASDFTSGGTRQNDQMY